MPGLAPATIQQGRFVAQPLRARARGRGAKPFVYRDQGSMAVIGARLITGSSAHTRLLERERAIRYGSALSAVERAEQET